MNRTNSRDFFLLLIIFVVSRALIYLLDIHFDYQALYRNWQYLDVYTLNHQLLRGIWYDHTQPPAFNLLLGIILKIFGSQAPWIFQCLFKLLTLAIAFVLKGLLIRIGIDRRLALSAAILYLISPGTLILENDLFYTTLVSFLLLLSCRYLLALADELSWKNIVGFICPLVVLCLTRSVFHLVWLALLLTFFCLIFRRRKAFGRLALVSFVSLLFVGSWYIKNAVIFNSFSVSSWMGMNLARNVFHDASVVGKTGIESIEPFSPISAYRRFLPANIDGKYAGLNDRDLLAEFKNDSFLNAKQIGYLEVSKQYMAASLTEIKKHPMAFARNVMQSGIIFFTPVTRWSVIEGQARKIKYFDLLYSGNLSSFAEGKQQRRIALTLSAIPKIILYLMVLFWLVPKMYRQSFRKAVPPYFSSGVYLVNLFIIFVIGYVFVLSSIVEHYENMRFRFEVEPLFLILAAQAVFFVFKKRQQLHRALTHNP